jgi:hypothetical protein
MKFMQKELEELHKLLGRVCGEIVMSLTLRKVTGGKYTLRKWLDLLREAAQKLEKLAED